MKDLLDIYEKNSERFIVPGVPFIIRLDGRSFSKWTHGLQRPYDHGLYDIFDITTQELMKEFHVNIAYTASDEISLVFENEKESDMMFSRRIGKYLSLVTSYCTAAFNQSVALRKLENRRSFATFDCRLFHLPDKETVIDYLSSREKNNTTNAISMLAQHYFSHNELQGKNSKEMQEMLFRSHNISFNDFPVRFKRGRYFVKREVSIPFTAEEIEKLPASHEARKNPNLCVQRKKIFHKIMPPLHCVSNPVDTLFYGHCPIQIIPEVFE